MNSFIEGFTTKPLVVALCETWLSDNNPTSLYKINGFSKIATHKRSGEKRGGCAFLVNGNDEFTVKHLGDQIQGLTITIKIKQELHNITVLYRPPTFAISSFLDLFENYLSTIHHLKGDRLACGDFDIDFIGSHNSNFFKSIKVFNLNLPNH